MRDFSWLNWRAILYLSVIFILTPIFFSKKDRQVSDRDENFTEKLAHEGNIIDIFSGDYFTCALTSENRAFCWGFDPSNSLLSVPRKVPKEISVGLYSEFALAKNHTPDLSGTKKKKLLINSGITFEHIYKSNSYRCGLTPEHDLYCWGHYLNKPDLAKIVSPQPIFVYLNLPMNDLKFKSLTLGLNHICAITIYSDLYCWGDNALGQLGVVIPKYSDDPLALDLK